MSHQPIDVFRRRETAVGCATVAPPEWPTMRSRPVWREQPGRRSDANVMCFVVVVFCCSAVHLAHYGATCATRRSELDGGDSTVDGQINSGDRSCFGRWPETRLLRPISSGRPDRPNGVASVMARWCAYTISAEAAGTGGAVTACASLSCRARVIISLGEIAFCGWGKSWPARMVQTHPARLSAASAGTGER